MHIPKTSDAQTSLGGWDTDGFSNHGQTTRRWDSQQKRKHAE